jgi:hypothetical protein
MRFSKSLAWQMGWQIGPHHGFFTAEHRGEAVLLNRNE